MSRKLVTPTLCKLYDLTPEQVALLTEAGEEPQAAAAVMLGATALESMETAAALRTGALEQVGDSNPNLVSPVKVQTRKHNILRGTGDVLPFSVGVTISHTRPKGGATPEVVAL